LSARQSFARVPVAVFGDRRLSVRDMRVLGALYAHADAHGLCWPSLGTIGEVAALDRRDAQRALRRLGAAAIPAVPPSFRSPRLETCSVTARSE